MSNTIYTKINGPTLVFIKIHYIYKITNLLNNKFYIGKHTQKIGKIDNYYGSGNIIKSAVKKYGIKNFKKEIISFHDTWCLAYMAEKLVLPENVVNNKQCYNMKPGGLGGAGLIRSEETKQKISKSHIGKTKTKEHVANLSKSQKGKKLTDEHKRKLSIRFSGEKNNMYGKGYKLKGRKHSEESIQKMSNSMKGEKNPQYGKKKTKNILEKISTKCSINGQIYYSLHEASRQLNISRQTISNRCKSDKFKDYFYC